MEFQEENRYTHSETIAEALLFASGEPVDISDICEALKLTKRETRAVLAKIADRYDSLGSGIMLREVNDKFQLSTRPALREDLRPYFEKEFDTPLSRPAIETLTIIAYNQPITRGNIEIIRGVNSDGILTKLLERGLICEIGRSEGPGRPILYATTDLFLQSIGVSSLSELKQFDIQQTEPAKQAEPDEQVESND